MALRNRPTLDRRHRPRWQDDLRSQQLIVAGFALAIAVALGIFAATSWSDYYNGHLKEVATVGGASFDRDALTKRTGIMAAELEAKATDLNRSSGGAHDQFVQQELQSINDQLNSIEADAASALTTGALLASQAPKYGISVASSDVDKEIEQRESLPFQLKLSVITVSALPANAASGATPTDAQWVAAKNAANSLFDQLKGGANFANLAKEKSSDAATKATSGLVGWIQEGDVFYGQYFDAAKKAKKGSLVGPVKGDTDYYVLKVEDMRAAGPDTLLKNLLTSVHATDADYRDYIREQLLTPKFQAYFGDHVLGHNLPQQHVAQIQIQGDAYPPKPMERVRHVLIQPIPGTQDQSKATQAQWKAALQRADKVYALLSKPNADWSAVAKQYGSDGTKAYGGDLGWYDPDTAAQSLDADFVAGMKKLALNEVSKPVVTKFGYHIIQVFEKRTRATDLAAAVVAELRKNPDSFGTVAARESSDHTSAAAQGDIGWVARYEKDTALEQAIFGLKKVGDISDPVVDTDGSLYIFKLLGTSTARFVDDQRLSTLKATGYSRWSDELKAQVGVWIDPTYQSTAASGATG